MKLHTTRLLVSLGVVSALATAAHGAIIAEIETNDTLSTAQDVSGSFSTGSNSDIGSQFGIDPAVTPWVSITSSTGSGFDYYSFSTSSFGDISVDIDYGYDFGGSVDTEAALWEDLGGGLFDLITGDDDSSVDPGSTSGLDSELHVLNRPAGDYVVGVGRYNTSYSDTGLAGRILDDGNSYTLNITAAASISAIPEPSSVGALGGLLLSVLLVRRRKQR